MKSDFQTWMQHWSKFYSYLCKNQHAINKEVMPRIEIKKETTTKIILIRFFIVLYYIKLHKITIFKEAQTFDELLSIHSLVSKTKPLNQVFYKHFKLFDPNLYPIKRQLDFSGL